MTKFFVAIGLILALSTQASAITEVFTGSLTGAQENPPVATSGTGSGTATYDSVANTLAVSVNFSGLSSNTNNAHIHCCAMPPTTPNAGVAIDFVGPGFPLGVTSGSFNHTFDLGQTSTYSGAYLAASGGTANGARDRLLNSMRGMSGGNLGVAYFNIHTVNFGPGEIRGNIARIPEPATLMLIAFGAMPLIAFRRLRSA
jgi:hypothetical protein